MSQDAIDAFGWAQDEASIREALQQRKTALFEVFEQGYVADMKNAWQRGYDAGAAAGQAKGKEDGIAEGKLQGRKQGVIYVALNLLRDGTDPEKVAKMAELPELIIRKIAADNDIALS